MKKLIALLMAGGMLAGASFVADAKPLTVWEDPTDDAGPGQTGPLPVFTQAGLDLTSGAIEKKGANLEFTVTHASMPPSGSFPEGARFLWNFTVDGEPYRLTVKSADIGKPDVVGGQTTERVGRADVNGHFRLEGECVTDASLPLNRVNCPPLGYFDGTFDPASASFTAIIPLSAVKAKKGSVVGPGGVNICAICWVTQVAERSVDATIIDSAVQIKTYKVPR